MHILSLSHYQEVCPWKGDWNDLLLLGVYCAVQMHWQCSLLLLWSEKVIQSHAWYLNEPIVRLALATLLFAETVAKLTVAVFDCFALHWCRIEAICHVTFLSPWRPQDTTFKQTIQWKECGLSLTGVIQGHFFCQPCWNFNLNCMWTHHYISCQNFGHHPISASFGTVALDQFEVPEEFPVDFPPLPYAVITIWTYQDSPVSRAPPLRLSCRRLSSLGTKHLWTRLGELKMCKKNDAMRASWELCTWILDESGLYL